MNFLLRIRASLARLPRITAPLQYALLSLLVLVCNFSFVFAQEPPTAEHPVRASIVTRHEALDTSDVSSQLSTTVGIEFIIEPGWHIYWQNSGDSATPTKVRWTISNGWSTSELHWPTPWRFIERGEMTTFGYRESALLLTEVQAVTPAAYQDDTLQISAEVKWLVCKDVCIPGKTELNSEIALGAETVFAPSAGKIQLAEKELPQPSVPGISVQALTIEHTVADKPALEVLLRVTGLTPNPSSSTPEVQFFPGVSDHVTAGKPQAAWLGTTLHVRAPLHNAATDSTTPPALSGLLAISAAHSSSPVTITWTLPSTLSSLPTEVSTLPFVDLTHRQIHWNESHDTADQPARQGNPANSPSSSIFELALVTLFAFLGGLILNLMPCVLPIIAIKVMSFVEHSKNNSDKGVNAFCLGILCTCLCLAFVVIGLRSLGVQLGWGFQFQHPEFVLVLTIVIFLLCLGFFDMYALALPFTRQCCSAVDSLPPSRSKHFFDGVIATILSTPCTAPFLGTALVFAFTRGPLVTVAIHLAIGLGLACPYFILARNPRLLTLLPKPGTWMQRLRQFLGFMLLGTVLWLLFVLQRLTGSGVVWCLLLLLLILFSLWLYDWGREVRTRRSLVMRLCAGAIVIGSLIWLTPKILHQTPPSSHSPAAASASGGEIPWQPYSTAAVEQALAEGKPVFIDFTADWCITCKANEFLIIDTTEVRAALKKYNVQPLIADWTRGDEHITNALSSYGARGVPLYVVLSPNGKKQPVVLSTIPSKDALISSLQQASAGQ